MSLTSKLDLGILIAGVGALAVVGAVIAGFFAVGSPEDARARRLDDARLLTMQQVATGAQCAFTFTNRVPASVEEIHASIVNQRAIASAAYYCSRVAFVPPIDRSVTYQAEGGDHIRLCADFNRATPSSSDNAPSPYAYMLAEFPELQAPRARAGRHCYSIRLVKQVAQDPQANSPPEQ